MLQKNSKNDQLSIILKGIINPNYNIRKSAEEKITLFFLNNFGDFLLELSKKISTETEEKQVRQISATLIKMVNKKENVEKWFNLPENIKKTIKDNVLSTLNSNDIDIRKAAALALASICKIEIPKGKWLNIFDVLINTSQNTNINVQLSSLTALEYIYEEINKGDIPNQTVANLLNTYYSLLNKQNTNPELIINILSSIDKFLPFISDFINEPNSKIKFYDLIEKFVRDTNEKVRKITLQIFIDICKIYYDSLDDYLDKICLFTQIITENDIESNKIICVDIWCNIGYEEEFRNEINHIKRKSHNYLQKYFPKLSEICLKFIATEDYYNEEDSISKVCYALISNMSICCSYDFILIMLNYIKQNLNHQSEKIKYSALKVFNSIICTIHKKNFYPIIKDSLQTISEILFNNAPIHFKNLAAVIIKSITKYFSKELIADTIYFDKMIRLYLELFKISSKEILYTLLISLNNLIKSITWSEEDETNILSKYMKDLCLPLSKLCQDIQYYDTKNNVISMSLNVLGTLGERSALDVKEQMSNLFIKFAEIFQKTLDDNNILRQNLEIYYNYQEYLCSCLTGFLATGMAEKQIAYILLQNVITSFVKRKSLYDEGIMLIGAISLYTRKYFDSFMQIVSPYLIQGLQSIDSPSICKRSIICLSDIIRALEEENKYVNDFLPLILNILANNNVDQSLKPYCFMILSDIFLYCEKDGFKSFNSIMEVIGGAIQATQIKSDENSEQETCKYFINLRENILETITCIFSTVKEMKKTEEFIPFVSTIINYINFIEDDFAISIDIIKNGLFLIGDFCRSYKGSIKHLLNSLLINNMLEKLEKDEIESKDRVTLESIKICKNAINEVLLNY